MVSTRSLRKKNMHEKKDNFGAISGALDPGGGRSYGIHKITVKWWEYGSVLLSAGEGGKRGNSCL